MKFSLKTLTCKCFKTFWNTSTTVKFFNFLKMKTFRKLSSPFIMLLVIFFRGTQELVWQIVELVEIFWITWRVVTMKLFLFTLRRFSLKFLLYCMIRVDHHLAVEIASGMKWKCLAISPCVFWRQASKTYWPPVSRVVSKVEKKLA